MPKKYYCGRPICRPDTYSVREQKPGADAPLRRYPEVDNQESSDDQLAAALQEHDLTAFSSIYDRYANLVFSVCLRVLRDAQLAEDITQEVFLRVWRSPDRFVATRGRLVTWLVSVARNRAVDEIRLRGRRQRREAFPHPDGYDGPSTHLEDDPLASVQLQDERRVIREALNTLPAEQRQVIELAYFGGLTQQEIARDLGQPLGTVKTRIRLGMQKLRAVLTAEGLT